jgi:hypothetical protein
MSFTFEALKAVDASALTAYFDIVDNYMRLVQ